MSEKTGKDNDYPLVTMRCEVCGDETVENSGYMGVEIAGEMEVRCNSCGSRSAQCRDCGTSLNVNWDSAEVVCGRCHDDLSTSSEYAIISSARIVLVLIFVFL